MRKVFIITACMLLTAITAMAQSSSTIGKNYISTGMPILLIAPDAVSSAMGDAGVASSPDANSSYWNNAKYAFVDKNIGFTTTYTPWLRNIGVSDMNFLYLAGYKRINDRSSAAASLTYFSLGEIQHTSETGDDQGTFLPNEMAFDITYAMKLSDNLSLGASGRYMRSDLTNGMQVEDQTTKAATGLAADVGLYYQQRIDKNQEVAAGLHISNLGSKLSYSNDDTQNEFLPANLRIGGRYSYEVDNYNKINFLVDLNKLLVPTPPYVSADGDTTYSKYYANMTEYNNTSSMQGAINSFFDAPGGVKEELSEISVSAGAEYWYAETFAVRAGYFYESANKGDRQYATFGVGIRYSSFRFDLAYLLPTSRLSTNPLSNTLRISLSVDFGNEKK